MLLRVWNSANWKPTVKRPSDALACACACAALCMRVPWAITTQSADVINRCPCPIKINTVLLVIYNSISWALHTREINWKITLTAHAIIPIIMAIIIIINIVNIIVIIESQTAKATKMPAKGHKNSLHKRPQQTKIAFDKLLWLFILWWLHESLNGISILCVPLTHTLTHSLALSLFHFAKYETNRNNFERRAAKRVPKIHHAVILCVCMLVCVCVAIVSQSAEEFEFECVCVCVREREANQW